MMFEHPETSKAIDLYNKFLMPAANQRKVKMNNESLRSLWDGYCLQLFVLLCMVQCLKYILDTAAEAEHLDPATVLGQDLVDIITKKTNSHLM